MIRLPLLVFPLLLAAGCNASKVVHLQTLDPQRSSQESGTWRASVLTPSTPQALGIGGTRLDGTRLTCDPGLIPTDITVCIGNSEWCTERTKEKAVAGVRVFYQCASPNPPSNGGLGPPPRDN